MYESLIPVCSENRREELTAVAEAHVTAGGDADGVTFLWVIGVLDTAPKRFRERSSLVEVKTRSHAKCT